MLNNENKQFTEKQFDALSIGAKLLYGMMIDRMELSQKNGWIDKKGRAYIYFTVDEVKNRFSYLCQKFCRYSTGIRKEDNKQDFQVR